MKRLGNVFEQIIDYGNLKKAAFQARKGKQQQTKILDFFYHLEYHLVFLQQQLINKTYLPGEFYIFTIKDPKKRTISAAPFIDRVLHHAICHIIEPWYEKMYIYDSYACRKGKGQHRALQRAQYFARKYQYYCKFDIANFFASIDRNTLFAILQRKIKDKKLLWLLEVIIKNSPGCNGVPIGNLTSQHFANIYLNELDHYIKEYLQIKGYCRYMDDAIIFADSKESLWHYKVTIIHFLETHLQLKLNEKATFLRPVQQGIPFLGFYVFGKLIRLQRKAWVRFRCKFKKRQYQYLHGEITEQYFINSISGLVNHIRQANTWRLRGLFFDEHEMDF